MTKSKFVIDKLAKLFEQGFISYQDLSSEMYQNEEHTAHSHDSLNIR